MCNNEETVLPLSCPLCCQTSFPNVDTLKLCLLKVTSRPIKCPICDEILLGLDKLTIHLFAHSLIQEHVVERQQPKEDVQLVRKPRSRKKEPKRAHVPIKQEQSEELPSPVTPEETETKFQCHLCHKTFKMNGSLKIHLRVAHYGFHIKFDPDPQSSGDSGPAIGGQPQQSLFTVAQTSASEADQQRNENSCEVCGKTFTTKYFLKKHKRLHTGETPYACQICGKTFTFQQSYHKHLLYHSDEKKHVCSICNRAFKELSTLHNHERIHSGEKPFKCETCNKCFRQRVSYLVHRRIHTGALPYKCTACDKSFRYKVSQRTHKCTAQPPGTVVRQTGDLLQKLLHSAAIYSQGSEEDPISRSLDELVNESCDKMGIENGFSIPLGGESVPSPSECMKHLTLLPSSPETATPSDFHGEGSTVNSESLRMLLYHDKID